jgi:hypothetical protein
MEEKINNLGANNNFVFINLNITDKEKNLIERIKINKTSEYERFGNLEVLKNEIPEFLHRSGNTDDEVNQTICNIIFRTTKETIKAAKKETVASVYLHLPVIMMIMIYPTGILMDIIILLIRDLLLNLSQL